MKPVPLFLIIVSLPLLLGGCGEKSSSEGSESVSENPTAPSEEVNRGIRSMRTKSLL